MRGAGTFGIAMVWAVSIASVAAPARAKRTRLSRVVESSLRQVRPRLAAADFEDLRSCLVPDSTAPRAYPRSTAGRRPCRTVVIPGQDGARGDLARLVERSGSTCVVQFRGQKLQVDAAGVDRHHDYSPWRNSVTFADIAVDLKNDASARRFVRDTVRRIDRSRPELEQIARAMTLIHGRLRYDSDYRVVVPEGLGAPRPFGLYLEQGRGVCRQFAVALKLVCDGLDIKCRLERGTLGPTVLPLPLRRKLKQQLDVRMCTRINEIGTLCAGSAARRGFHIYDEIQLKDGTCYTADPTGKVLAPTTRAVATGLLRPIFDNPWYSYISTGGSP